MTSFFMRRPNPNPTPPPTRSITSFFTRGPNPNPTPLPPPTPTRSIASYFKRRPDPTPPPPSRPWTLFFSASTNHFSADVRLRHGPPPPTSRFSSFLSFFSSSSSSSSKKHSSTTNSSGTFFSMHIKFYDILLSSKVAAGKITEWKLFQSFHGFREVVVLDMVRSDPKNKKRQNSSSSAVSSSPFPLIGYGSSKGRESIRFACPETTSLGSTLLFGLRECGTLLFFLVFCVVSFVLFCLVKAGATIARLFAWITEWRLFNWFRNVALLDMVSSDHKNKSKKCSNFWLDIISSDPKNKKRKNSSHVSCSPFSLIRDGSSKGKQSRGFVYYAMCFASVVLYLLSECAISILFPVYCMVRAGHAIAALFAKKQNNTSSSSSSVCNGSCVACCSSSSKRSRSCASKIRKGFKKVFRHGFTFCGWLILHAVCPKLLIISPIFSLACALLSSSKKKKEVSQRKLKDAELKKKESMAKMKDTLSLCFWAGLNTIADQFDQ